MTNKKINILNLITSMGEFLTHYFSHDDFHLVERDELSPDTIINYVFIEDLEHLDTVLIEFPTLKDNVKFVAFNKVGDFKGFLLSNGRAVLNRDLEESFINEFNLNRLFRERSNIHLEEELSSQIPEFNNFKVTNHLMMGSFIDELSVLSFENDFNLVPIRSFIDHTIYYYAYLKQAGLAGVPFEVEYGFAKDFLVINTHVNVKNFIAEYMLDCFGDTNSKDPLKYLLKVVKQSCDFLDISYLEKPQKICITGMFQKKGSSLSEGVSFHQIECMHQIVKNVDKKLKEFKPQAIREQELSVKKQELKEKELPNGFGSFSSGLSNSSELSGNDDAVQNIVEYMVKRFENSYPNQDLHDFNIYHFEEFAPQFRPVEVLYNLSQDEKEVIIEKIRNFKLLNAFQKNINGAKEALANDKVAIEALNEVMGQGFAEVVSQKVGLEDVNEILSEKKTSFLEESKKNIDDNLISIEDSFEILDDPFAEDEVTQVSGILEDVDLTSVVSGDVPDLVEEVSIIGGGEGLDDILSSIPPFLDAEDSSTNVSGHFDEKEGVIKIGGGDAEPEEATLVKGGAEEADNFVQTIKSLPEEDKDNLMAVFSNSFDEGNKKEIYNFKSSNKEERDNQLRCFVKNTLDKNEKLNGMAPSVKAFLHKEGPKLLSQALKDFANEKGVEIEELSEQDLDEFQGKKIPEVLSYLVNDESRIDAFHDGLESYFQKNEKQESPFIKKFKTLLESKLSNVSGLEKKGDEYLAHDGDIPEVAIKNAIKETIKETFDTELALENATSEEIKAKENTMVKELSILLGLSEGEIRAMVDSVSLDVHRKEEGLLKEKLLEDDEGAQSFSNEEEVLLNKLKSLEDENKNLKTRISALQLESEADKFSNKKINAISAASNIDTSEVDLNEDIRPTLNHLEKSVAIESLEDGKAIGSDLAEKVKQVLERENQLIEQQKKSEVTIKKMELEAEKKDSLMGVELKKAEKIIRGKDLILDKAKDSMKNLMEKKNSELVDLKTQVKELNQRLKDDKSVVLSGQVKALSTENNNLQKMVEVYRGKVESMAKNIENKKKADQASGLSEENRDLKRSNAQLENKLAAESKLKSSIEEKYNLARAQEQKLKTEASNAQAELRTVQGQLKLLKDQNTKLVQAAAASGNVSASKANKEAEALKAKNSKLKERIDSLNNKIKNLENPGTIESDLNLEEISKNPSRAKFELEKSLKEISRLKDANSNLNKKVEELDSKNNATGIKSLSEANTSPDNLADDHLQKELDLAKSQNEQLQLNIKDLIEKLRKTGEEDSTNSNSSDQASAKEKRLEQSVKKMNGELTKARSETAEKKKESIKFKAEVNKLKNQISRLEKDLEKAKRNSTKKKAA